MLRKLWTILQVKVTVIKDSKSSYVIGKKKNPKWIKWKKFVDLDVVVLDSKENYKFQNERKYTHDDEESEEGQAEFERRGFQADEPENVQVLQEAEDAIAAEQKALEQSAIDVNAQAKRSLSADARSADPEQALVDEARANQALKLLETREAGIKTLTEWWRF